MPISFMPCIPTHPQRLPNPYRAEAEVVATHLQFIADALDWTQIQQAAKPWVAAVRAHPPTPRV